MDNWKNSRNSYIEYKFNNIKPIESESYASMQVLSLLDRLAFPMYDQGVYVYKDLIMNVVELIKDYNYDNNLNVMEELCDQNSFLYRKFSSMIGIGLEDVHNMFNNMVCNINLDMIDQGMVSYINGEYSDILDYGELAFLLASMILGFKREKRENKLKIRSL